MLPLNRRHQQWTNHSVSSITVTLSKLGQKNESWSPIVRQSYRWHKEKYAKYSLGLVQHSLSLHARSRFSLPTTHIDYIIHDFHWLSMARVRSESDENWGKCKTTLHDDHAAADQTLDGDIRVCGFPQQLVAYIMQSYDRDWNWIIALSCELDPK